MAQLRLQQPREIEPLEARYKQAQETRSLATSQAKHRAAVVAAETEQNRNALLADWNTERPVAQANARRVLDGPGRLGLKLPAVNRANEALARWSVTWQPIIPTMPAGHADIAGLADRADDTPRSYAAVSDYARRQAEARHPDHPWKAAEAADADRGVQRAWLELRNTQRRHQHQLADFGNLGHTATPEQDLAQIEQQIATTQHRLAETRERITQLEHSLSIAQPYEAGDHAARPANSAAWIGQPADAVHSARTNWSAGRVAKQQAAQRETAIAVARTARDQQRSETWRRHDSGPTAAGPGHGIGR